jgi:hypothetical protein
MLMDGFGMYNNATLDEDNVDEEIEVEEEEEEVDVDEYVKLVNDGSKDLYGKYPDLVWMT